MPENCICMTDNCIRITDNYRHVTLWPILARLAIVIIIVVVICSGAVTLPIPLTAPLPLRVRQEMDEEGDIDAGGVTIVFPESWDEAMRDAEEEKRKKEDGLGDSKHAPKRTEEKGKEAEKEEAVEDVVMGQDE